MTNKVFREQEIEVRVLAGRPPWILELPRKTIGCKKEEDRSKDHVKSVTKFRGGSKHQWLKPGGPSKSSQHGGLTYDVKEKCTKVAECLQETDKAEKSNPKCERD